VHDGAHGGGEHVRRRGGGGVDGPRPAASYDAVEPDVHERHVVRRHLDPDGPPGGADQAQQLRRTAAAGRCLLELLHETAAEEVPGHGGDRGLRHLEPSGDLGAAERSRGTEQREHRAAGEIAGHPSSSTTY
jgi:hypothetical protein